MRTYHRVTFSARIVRPSLLLLFFCFLYLFALRFHALVGTLSLSLTVTGRRDDGSQHPSPSLGHCYYYHHVGSPRENSPADYVRPTDLPTARTRTVTFLKSLVPAGRSDPRCAR